MNAFKQAFKEAVTEAKPAETFTTVKFDLIKDSSGYWEIDEVPDDFIYKVLLMNYQSALKRDGAGRIECYTYAPKEECRNELFTVECRAASNLLNLIGTYASEYNRSILEWPDDNYGEWNLIMENVRGGLYRATGRLHPDIPAFSRDISNRIRELTGLAFLTAFDGGTGKR